MELCRWIKTEDAMEEKGAVPAVTRDSRYFPTEIGHKRATLPVEWAKRFHHKGLENVHSYQGLVHGCFANCRHCCADFKLEAKYALDTV